MFAPTGITTAEQGMLKVKLSVTVLSGPDGTGDVLADFNKEDITLLQLAQALQSGLLGVSSLSVKNTAGTLNTTTAAITAATPQIAFGTGTIAASFTDYSIETLAGGTNPVSATVGAISGNTFTVAATWNNTTGTVVNISELALYATTTAGFATVETLALTHDVFAAQAVSANGSAAATLTFTFS
jgi:hypothetical protein